MKPGFLLPVACLVATSVFAQRDFANVEIKATPVTGNIYMLEGAGGNIGVSAGPDGILIVDDQFAPLAEKIEAALRKLNPGKLKFVLNTHFHGDHTGGNAAFAAREATIVAQSIPIFSRSARSDFQRETVVAEADRTPKSHGGGVLNEHINRDPLPLRPDLRAKNLERPSTNAPPPHVSCDEELPQINLGGLLAIQGVGDDFLAVLENHRCIFG